MVAEWSKLFRSQVRISAWDYYIDRSVVEILCRYLNSRGLGDICRLRYWTEWNAKNLKIGTSSARPRAT